MAWLKALADSLFSSIIQGIMAYFEKERAEAAKWEAKARDKQLKSIKEGQAVEKQLGSLIEEAKNKHISVSDWNKKLLLLFILILPLSGCFRFYVSAPTYRPVPPVIERPTIPEDIDGDGQLDEWTEREIILRDYAIQLEAGYNGIREENKKHNENAGFPVSD